MGECDESYGGVDVYSHAFLTLALNGGDKLSPSTSQKCPHFIDPPDFFIQTTHHSNLCVPDELHPYPKTTLL